MVRHRAPAFPRHLHNALSVARQWFDAPLLGEGLVERYVRPHLMAAPLERNATPIPNYDKSEFTPELFDTLINRDLTPIVIRGFLKDSPAVKEWNVEYFDERHGDAEIMLRPLKKNLDFEISHMPGRLKEVTSGILNHVVDRKYIMNSGDIFTDNPELERMLPLEDIRRYFHNSKVYVGAQLFLGGEETGSGFHCASGYNIFLNVYGRKRWTVVHPRFSPWMSPRFRSDAFYVLSPILHNLPFDEIEERFPLYNRVPKMSYDLEPGDALINPSWYWHAVDNLSPRTIGVACRWFPPKPLVELNKLYAFIQATNPHMWKVWKRLLSGKRLKDHFNDF